MSSLTRAVAIGALAALSTGAACAADLDYPSAPLPAMEQAPAELGTGWYLRGDLGYAQSNHAPGIIAPGATAQTLDLSSARSVGIGGGYKFNTWFRADATVDFYTSARGSNVAPLDPASCNVALNVAAGCAVSGNGRYGHRTELVNAYLDLGTWGGLTPYIGAGAGFTQNHYAGSSGLVAANGGPAIDLTTGLASPFATRVGLGSGQTNHFAWALTAGASFAITPNLLIDASYRRVDMGRDPTAVQVVSGNTLARVAGRTARVIENEIRIGVRYMAD